VKDSTLERTDLGREQRALTLLTYVLTILIIRSLLFYYSNYHSIYLQLTVDRIHLHHFIFGILLLFVAGIIYQATGRRRVSFPAMLVGTGLGLIFDEASLWLPLNPGGYWSIENFFLTVGAGVILFLRVFPLGERHEPAPSKLNTVTLSHQNTPHPYITVVVPAFNEEQFLAGTLRSLTAQTLKDFELIVVDNNSSDKTADIARSFGAKVIPEPRQGVGYARQRGFIEAKGAIIATTDADTIVPVSWLSRIAQEFKNNGNLVAFGGLYTLYSGSIAARLAIAYLSYPLFKVDRFFCGGWSLPGANLAVRKQSFLQIGGFNTEIKLCEDVDISQRLRKVGEVMLAPNFKVRTSGRRFNHGLLHGLMTYAPNAIVRMLLKKHKFGRLATIRTEAPLSRKLSLTLPLFLLIGLFSMFYLSNPSISGAKSVTLIRQDAAVITERIENEVWELRYHLNRHEMQRPNPYHLNYERNL
jgi:glycosyltransferase involved in cell wall biosynthesis